MYSTVNVSVSMNGFTGASSLVLPCQCVLFNFVSVDEPHFFKHADHGLHVSGVGLLHCCFTVPSITFVLTHSHMQHTQTQICVYTHTHTHTHTHTPCEVSHLQHWPTPADLSYETCLGKDNEKLGPSVHHALL